MLATIVDWQQLGEVALASLIAGVGVTLAFSLAIVGAVRMAEYRRDGRAFEASAYGALMLLALAASGGAIAVGVIVMTTK
jgi:hypothetical protein